jgi:hypothetical protein
MFVLHKPSTFLRLILALLPIPVLAVGITPIDAGSITAATQLGCLNVLPGDSDWLFNFTTQPSSFEPGSVVKANAATCPASVENKLTMVMVNLGPWPTLFLMGYYRHIIIPKGSNYAVPILWTTDTYLI